MVMFELKLIVPRIIELMMLSILFGIGASWCWVLWHLLKGETLLPQRPIVARGKAPWGSGSILLVFILYIVTNILLFQGYMWLTGRPPSDETPAVPAAVPVAAPEKAASSTPELVADKSTQEDRDAEADQPPEIPAPRIASKKAAKDLSLLELMSIQAVVNTLLLVLLPVVLRRTSGARLHDLGLSHALLGRQVTIGVVAILFLMPTIFATQYFAIKLLGPFDEQFRHPVERMLREQFSGGVAGLAFVTAVILAPIFEEMMFRGIFQTWLVELLDRLGSRLGRRPAEPLDSRECVFLDDEPNPSTTDAGILIIEAAPTHPAEGSPDPIASSDPVRPEWSSDYWLPDDWEPPRSLPKKTPSLRPSPIAAGTAIVVTSLVFAILHAGQWPAPIPIFILALGLGLVYHRTNSLLAAICMHALFNASSTLALIYSLLVGVPAANEKEVPPPAVEQNAPVEKRDVRAQDVAPSPD